MTVLQGLNNAFMRCTGVHGFRILGSGFRLEAWGLGSMLRIFRLRHDSKLVGTCFFCGMWDDCDGYRGFLRGVRDVGCCFNFEAFHK